MFFSLGKQVQVSRIARSDAAKEKVWIQRQQEEADGSSRRYRRQENSEGHNNLS